MLHPKTELRYVSSEIGYGIFATEDIPCGTITWTKDQLDRTFTQEEVNKLTPPNYENLMKYTYREKTGLYFFCWDLTRFINHSFEANTMLTSLGFEIALRDIKAGEELTNDYGTLNIIEAFECANGPTKKRENVCPDDLIKFYPEWDLLIEKAITFVDKVSQPLSPFLTAEQNLIIQKVIKNEMALPSIKENYYHVAQ